MKKMYFFLALLGSILSSRASKADIIVCDHRNGCHRYDCCTVVVTNKHCGAFTWYGEDGKEIPQGTGEGQIECTDAGIVNQNIAQQVYGSLILSLDYSSGNVNYSNAYGTWALMDISSLSPGDYVLQASIDAANGLVYVNFYPCNGVMPVNTSPTTFTFDVSSYNNPSSSPVANSGIKEQMDAFKDLKIYPNPVVGDLTINLPTNLKANANTIINVTDVTGKRVISAKLNANGTTIIPFSTLAKGSYTYCILMEEQVAKTGVIIKK